MLVFIFTVGILSFMLISVKSNLREIKSSKTNSIQISNQSDNGFIINYDKTVFPEHKIDLDDNSKYYKNTDKVINNSNKYLYYIRDDHNHSEQISPLGDFFVYD